MRRATVTERAAILAFVLAGCGGGGGGSVGAVFGRDNETRALVVREAPPGAGAGKAGLLPGDQVVMIDGWYVRDMSATDIRARLRGEVGSTVRLTIVRGEDGGEVRHVKVTRGELGERRAVPPKEEKIAE